MASNNRADVFTANSGRGVNLSEQISDVRAPQVVTAGRQAGRSFLEGLAGGLSDAVDIFKTARARDKEKKTDEIALDVRTRIDNELGRIELARKGKDFEVGPGVPVELQEDADVAIRDLKRMSRLGERDGKVGRLATNLAMQRAYRDLVAKYPEQRQTIFNLMKSNGYAPFREEEIAQDRDFADSVTLPNQHRDVLIQEAQKLLTGQGIDPNTKTSEELTKIGAMSFQEKEEQRRAEAELKAREAADAAANKSEEERLKNRGRDFATITATRAYSSASTALVTLRMGMPAGATQEQVRAALEGGRARLMQGKAEALAEANRVSNGRISAEDVSRIEKAYDELDDIIKEFATGDFNTVKQKIESFEMFQKTIDMDNATALGAYYRLSRDPTFRAYLGFIGRDVIATEAQRQEYAQMNQHIGALAKEILTRNPAAFATEENAAGSMQHMKELLNKQRSPVSQEEADAALKTNKAAWKQIKKTNDGEPEFVKNTVIGVTNGAAVLNGGDPNKAIDYANELFGPASRAVMQKFLSGNDPDSLLAITEIEAAAVPTLNNLNNRVAQLMGNRNELKSAVKLQYNANGTVSVVVDRKKVDEIFAPRVILQEDPRSGIRGPVSTSAFPDYGKPFFVRDVNELQDIAKAMTQVVMTQRMLAGFDPQKTAVLKTMRPEEQVRQFATGEFAKTLVNQLQSEAQKANAAPGAKAQAPVTPEEGMKQFEKSFGAAIEPATQTVKLPDDRPKNAEFEDKVFSMGEYKKRMTQKESGGKVDAKNPRSSATGKFQITDGTWLDLLSDTEEYRDKVKQARNDPAVRKELLDLRVSDQELNRQMALKLTRQNRAVMRKGIGRDPTMTETYYGHFFGAPTAAALITAEPDELAFDVISEITGSAARTREIFRANPELLREDMTAQEALTSVGKYFNK